MRRLPLFQMLLAVVLVFVGGLAFLDVFTTIDLVPWLLGAAVLPPLLALITRAAWRPHLAVSTLVGGVVFVVFLAVSVFRNTSIAHILPTSETFSLIVDGIRNGWAEILSSTVPVAHRPVALFVPVALTWSASFVIVEMLCRTRRVFVAILPAVVLGVVGTMFAERVSGQRAVGMTIFVALAAGLLAARGSAFAGDPRPFDQREDTRAADPSAPPADVAWALWRQRMAIALPFVTVVVVLASPIARSFAFVDTDRQFVLRDHYTIPLDRSNDLNPLTAIAAKNGSDIVRFTVKVDQPSTNRSRFVLTLLDQFDGVQWTNKTEYVTVGSKLPPPSDLGSQHHRVEQTIEVIASQGPGLPALGRPVELDMPTDIRAQADPLTGALIAKDASTTSFEYKVVSEVGDYDMEKLVSANIATAGTARNAATKTDELPPELAKIREEVMLPAVSPFGQIARLLAFFHNNKEVNPPPNKQFLLDPTAPGGFTLGHVTEFLKTDGSRVGKPEQFATAFATLVRASGFPARIVVGYVPPDPLQPGTSYDLRDRDLTAWVEIALDGIGWVAFDPTPVDLATSKPTVEEMTLDDAINKAVAEQPDQSIPPPQNCTTNPNGLNCPQPPAADAGTSNNRLAVLVVLVGVLAALSALVLSPWFRKRRRAARRRAAQDPADRVAGAWLEAMDRMSENDVEGSIMLTTDQAALVAESRFGERGAAALRAMGPLVNRSLHAEDPPAPDVGHQVWHLSDEFASAVHETQSVAERVKARLDRRPLVGKVAAKNK